AQPWRQPLLGRYSTFGPWRRSTPVVTPGPTAGRTAHTERIAHGSAPARSSPRHRAAPALFLNRAGAALSPAARSFRATDPAGAMIASHGEKPCNRLGFEALVFLGATTRGSPCGVL